MGPAEEGKSRNGKGGQALRRPIDAHLHNNAISVYEMWGRSCYLGSSEGPSNNHAPRRRMKGHLEVKLPLTTSFQRLYCVLASDATAEPCFVDFNGLTSRRLVPGPFSEPPPVHSKARSLPC